MQKFFIVTLLLTNTKTALAGGGDITCDQVIQSISNFEHAHDGRTPTLDETLAQLPAAFRARFTLMRRSQSAQSATPLKPRVIMFGTSGQAIVAFNAEDSERGALSLEMACSDPENGKLSFRLVKWSADQTQAQVSESNPEQCLSCHGPLPHYNWDAYPDWDGVYGSRFDGFAHGSTEDQDFRAFRANAKDLPRYRQLNFMQNQFGELYPYRFRTSIETLANHNLGVTVVGRQARDRATRFSELPLFPTYGYSLALFLNDCDAVTDLSTVKQATGLSTLAEAASRLGFDLKEVEKFHKGPSTPEDQYYGDGFISFRGLWGSNIRSQLATIDASMVPFYRPVTFREIATRYRDYGPISSFGEDIVEAFSKLSPVLLHSGSDLTDGLLRATPLWPSDAQVKAACDALAARQLEVLNKK